MIKLINIIILENWLKRLIGISKRQLYSRVKQKAESKSNKENKTENENETDEPSSSETNSEENIFKKLM
jgi:hypothetical protein